MKLTQFEERKEGRKVQSLGSATDAMKEDFAIQISDLSVFDENYSVKPEISRTNNQAKEKLNYHGLRFAGSSMKPSEKVNLSVAPEML